MKADKYQELALVTWHGEEDPHSHPLLKLLGEFGEFVEVYVKSLYKPGYCPDFLEELGDIWYYIRIIAYQKNLSVIPFINYHKEFRSMAYYSHEAIFNNFLFHYYRYYSEHQKEQEYRTTNFNYEYALCRMTFWFLHLIEKHSISIEELTHLNAERLKDHHGWKKNEP